MNLSQIVKNAYTAEFTEQPVLARKIPYRTSTGGYVKLVPGSIGLEYCKQHKPCSSYAESSKPDERFVRIADAIKEHTEDRIWLYWRPASPSVKQSYIEVFYDPD